MSQERRILKYATFRRPPVKEGKFDELLTEGVK
jgi:hypothetical protein